MCLGCVSEHKIQKPLPRGHLAETNRPVSPVFWSLRKHRVKLRKYSGVLVTGFPLLTQGVERSCRKQEPGVRRNWIVTPSDKRSSQLYFEELFGLRKHGKLVWRQKGLKEVLPGGSAAGLTGSRPTVSQVPCGEPPCPCNAGPWPWTPASCQCRPRGR